jgi:hypothetical protein
MPCSASMFVKPSASNSEWLTRKRLIDSEAAESNLGPFSFGKPLSARNHRPQHPVSFPFSCSVGQRSPTRH